MATHLKPSGIDPAQLQGTKAAMEADETAGLYRMVAGAEWQGGCKAALKIGKYWRAGKQRESEGRDFSLLADRPESLAGSNAGPTGMELVLSGLAASLVASYATAASEREVELEALQVEVTGDADLSALAGAEGEPPGFQNVRVKTFVKSRASREALQELRQVAEARCSVLDTLRQPQTVLTSVAPLEGQH